MTTQFTSNAYLTTIKENTEYGSIEAIAAKVKFNHQFTYVVPDRNRYKYHEAINSQKNSGHTFRIIAAVPSALFSGVCKTTYHLALAVFIGVPLSIIGEGLFLKRHVFNFARDLQESYGYLTSIFFRSYGTYHIEESDFHKTCYSLWNLNTPNTHHVDPIPPRHNPQFPRQKPQLTISELLDKGYIDEAVNRLNNSTPTFMSDPLYVKAINVYISRGELYKAISAVGKIILDFRSKDELYGKIAKLYIAEGNLENAEVTIKKIDITFDVKDDAYVDLSEAYFKTGNLEKAISAVEKVSIVSKKKEPLIFKYADFYFERGDIDNSIITAKKIIRRVNSANDFFVKAFDKLLDLGQLDKAKTIIDLIRGDTKIMESLLIKIANRYYDEGIIENAIACYEKVCNAKELRESFWIKVADYYMKIEKVDDAIKIINKISFDRKGRDACLQKVAEHYLNTNDVAKADKIIEEILDRHIKLLLYKKNAARPEASASIDNKILTIETILKIQPLVRQEDFEGIMREIQETCRRVKPDIDSQGIDALSSLLLEVYLNPVLLEMLESNEDRHHSISIIKQLKTGMHKDNLLLEAIESLVSEKQNDEAAKLAKEEFFSDKNKRAAEKLFRR